MDRTNNSTRSARTLSDDLDALGGRKMFKSERRQARRGKVASERHQARREWRKEDKRFSISD